MSAANVQIRLRQYRSFRLKPQNKPAYLLGLKPCSLRRANLDQVVDWTGCGKPVQSVSI